MNELCDYINQWEKRSIDWDRSLINNGHLLVDQELELDNKQIIKDIKKIYDEFDTELRESHNKEINIKSLAEEYKSKLKRIVSDDYLLANYCIKTAYRSISSDKVLCWILFGDVMINNLKNNSDERKELKIVETDENDSDGKEFLGKYYKLIKKE